MNFIIFALTEYRRKKTSVKGIEEQSGKRILGLQNLLTS